MSKMTHKMADSTNVSKMALSHGILQKDLYIHDLKSVLLETQLAVCILYAR